MVQGGLVVGAWRRKVEGTPADMTAPVPVAAAMPVTLHTETPRPRRDVEKVRPEAGTDRIVEVKHEHEHTTTDMTSVGPLPHYVSELTGSAVEVTFLTTDPADVAEPV